MSAPDAEKRHSVEFLRFDLNLVIPKFAEFTEVWIITGRCADFAGAQRLTSLFRASCVCSKEDTFEDIMAKLVSLLLLVGEKFAIYVKIDDHRRHERRRISIDLIFVILGGKVERLSEW